LGLKGIVENAVKRAAKSLAVVGEAAAIKGKELEVTTEEAALALAALTISIK